MAEVATVSSLCEEWCHEVACHEVLYQEPVKDGLG